MHHLYPSSKGDQLCPLGFHPQVRWPTRCKRCFRDYKEHGGKRGGDDLATSSPNLTDSSNAKPSRSWTSSQNLSSTNGNGNDVELRKRPQSWTSTPDLDEADGKSLLIKPVENNVDVSLSVKIPQRRHTTTLDSKELEDTFTMRQPSTSSQDIPNDLVIQYTDNLAERVRKMNLLKKQKSEGSREASRERSLPRKDESNVQTNTAPPDRPERKQSSNSNSSDSSSRRSITPTKKVSTSSSASSSGTKASSSTDTSSNNSVSSLSSKSSHKSQTKKDSDKKKASDDVEFMLKIKDNQKRASGKFNDNTSMTTETTGTTIIAAPEHELKEEINALRSELDVMRSRAERAERDKSDILLRRLAAIDTGPNRTAASEALSLQQKVNELKSQLEKVNDEKRNLNARLKELESGPKSAEYDLRRKLQAAEQLCEELMEENTAVKREVRGLEAEMEEMHDSFRDTQAEVNTSLQKQLESTTKNCRILSFKLKKSERKIEILEQEKEAQGNVDTVAKIKKLEEELRFANELARTLQAEAENLKHPNKKKPPMLGVIGKSTSADGKITRESLTRGGSQEDPQQLLRDLQDSIERESDLKEQLKFSEQEAENLRKKLVRFEDENESMMMQLKKMASRSRSRKLSPTPNRLTPERATGERDEGISDEDDATELKILLDLNEQEAAILRLKVEDLEKQNTDVRTQLKELQEKFKNTEGSRKFSGFFGTNTQSDKTVKTLNEELNTLRKSLIEKDTVIQRLQAEVSAAKTKNSSSSDLNVRKQLDSVEQEATILRSKITSLETENEKLLKENKRMQLQSLRKPSINDSEKSSGEIVKLKESLGAVEKERDELQAKIKRILQETEEKLPNRTPHNITDLTPKNTLKRWVGDLEDEIKEMRAIILNSGADKTSRLETENASLKKDLENAQEKLKAAESDLKKLKVTSSSSVKASDLKKAEDETKKQNSKIRELEDKIKKQDVQIKEVESAKTAIESQAKKDKEKLSNLEKDYEKERKDKDKLEGKVAQIETEFTAAKKSADKLKATLEKEIKELKSKSANSRVDASSSRQVQDLKKQLEDLQTELKNEQKKYSDLNAHWENLSEETVLMRAQLTTEKDNLKAELTTLTQKLLLFDQMKTEKFDISKKLKEAQKKIQDLESKQLKVGAAEYEKTLLKNTIAEKEQEFDRLRRENEMNIDLIFQLRKDNDDLNQKLNDFNRVEQAQLSLNGHNATLQNEIKSLRIKLENSELSAKSEVASTRLRYEQQVKTLSAEMSSMQRQCERFKKDRDTFKQLLESAQKKIGDLKANTGRQSRGSMHSSDDDDKSKIAYLEQQIGCLEDQLCEARLDVSKYKTELVSERSANEIKIAEMQSKLNEFEEDRVIGSGRTKIPGMKTKLELSWQKEREDQQRLLQETSTLARDLRQTLFEVERERDKERLESKRRTDQLKRNTEEELEEGRKKIAELQCDLLELRDVHAKLRTSNEKLRRERERYEKELIKRRMEQDGGERKVGALLQTVDELVKIAPDLKRAGSLRETIPSTSSRQTLQPESASRQRSRSPSPSASASQITSVLARLAEASEELRKFQRMAEEENERIRLKRGNFRRAASQETDAAGNGPVISSRLVNSRLSRSNNGSLYRKSLSLDQSIQQDQAIWRQDDGSVSSVQSIDSEFGGLIRDSSMDSRLDSRLSGGSTQSDAPRGPRKKKRTLMGKLRSLTKSSRNSESELSVQGSDSDISVASDARTSRKDLRGRLSGMFRRSGSTSRSESMELGVSTSQPRPVAVTVVGDGSGPGPHNPPPSNTKPTRTIQKPPTPTTPITKRRIVKKD